MSLAQLLNMGKGKAEESKPPIAVGSSPGATGGGGSKRKLPEEADAAAATADGEPKVPAVTFNEDDRRLLQELTESQSDASREMAERRRKEEEQVQKAVGRSAIEDALQVAQQLAKRRKESSNPFSTGGQEFKPGIWVCDTMFARNSPPPMSWPPNVVTPPPRPQAGAVGMRFPSSAPSSGGCWGDGGCPDYTGAGPPGGCAWSAGGGGAIAASSGTLLVPRGGASYGEGESVSDWSTGGGQACCPPAEGSWQPTGQGTGNGMCWQPQPTLWGDHADASGSAWGETAGHP